MKLKNEFLKNFPILLTCALFVLLIISCAAGRKMNKVKPIIHEIASKTSRAHIITECTITLHGFNFDIEFANSYYDYEALRTQWRLGVDAPVVQNEESMVLRDRVILHLSPRGARGAESSLVSSILQFEMQKRDYKKKKWFYFSPDSAYQAQYVQIADDLKRRLRKRGYIFN